jgi:hypothetical protein
VGAVAIGIAAVVAVVLANDVRDVQAVDQNFALGFDHQVSNGTIDGAAAPGAGNIEAGGDRDIYSFTVPANTEIFIETFSVTSSGTLRWTLAPTSGPPVFANTFISNDPGRLLLTAGGAYTLTAFGDGAATGTYSFVIHSVPNPEFFSLALDQTVANGTIGGAAAPGAGNLEDIGSHDIYTLTGIAPGQQVFFEGVSTSVSAARWKMVEGTSGTDLFPPTFSGNDPGLLTLSAGGTYTIFVRTDANVMATGTYSFRIHSVAPAQAFSLALDQTVADGSIGGASQPGAGNLEAVQSQDIYHLTGIAAGEEIYIDSLTCGSSCSARFTLTHDSAPNTPLFSPGFISNDVGPLVLAAGGDYTLSVRTDSNVMSSGTYSFIVRDVPDAQQFSLVFGDTVASGTINGALAPGAGHIEQVGSRDVYTFDAGAGQIVTFDNLSSTNSALRWKLQRPGGQQVFDVLITTDQINVMLPDSGTYTLTASAGPQSVNTGTYSFTFDTSTPFTATPTRTATATPTNTVTAPTATSTSTMTPTRTNTTVPTSTNTPTPTATHTTVPPSSTAVPATSTPTSTHTATSTATSTNTPSPTSTNSPTATNTTTHTATATNTATATATTAPATATSTATPTRTNTSTSTPTQTNTPTGTATPTETVVAPTETQTVAPSSTPTATATDTASTATPTATTAAATNTPTVTNTPGATNTPGTSGSSRRTATRTATAVSSPTRVSTVSPATVVPLATRTASTGVTAPDTGTGGGDGDGGAPAASAVIVALAGIALAGMGLRTRRRRNA